MATDKTSRSADDLYNEARARMAEIIELSVYDDPDAITPVAGLLESARELDPKHVKSLVLLSDILLEIGAMREALEVIETLIELEPSNPSHAKKKALAENRLKDRSKATRDAALDFVEHRWNYTQDW